MCIFNFIFLLLGLTLLIIGIVVTSQFSNYVGILNNGYNVAPIFIILLGIVIALISFFGCYGAMRENRCMINFFAVCIIVILVAQIICVILAFVKKGEVEKSVDIVLLQAVKNYLNDPINKDFVDFTQSNLACCGALNYTDYMGVYPNATRVPKSCCRPFGVDRPCDTSFRPILDILPHDFYEEGCRHKLVSYLSTRIVIVAVVALVVCFIELLAILFACALSRNIDQYEMV